MVMTLILISSKSVEYRIFPKMLIYRGFFAIQLYWSHTSAWVISSKFAAFLQNIFSEEHLWRAASGHLNYNKKHICIEHIFLSVY